MGLFYMDKEILMTINHLAGPENFPTFFSKVDPVNPIGNLVECERCNIVGGLMFGADNSVGKYIPVWLCESCLLEILGVVEIN